GGELQVDPDLVRSTRDLDRQGATGVWDRSRPSRTAAPPPRAGLRLPPRSTRDLDRQPATAVGARSRRSRTAAPPRRVGFRPPSRITVLDRLDRDGLLPAITFIFSRAGCDAAVAQCVRSGLHLNPPEEAEEVRRIVASRVAALPAEDLNVLAYWEWLDGLRRGVAAHHAGLI